MSSATAKWKGKEAVVLDTYDATALLNAPFKVLLAHSAKEVRDMKGKLIEVIIPDPEGLVKAVAQTRVLHPHKLNGMELRFIRSALGLKSKELARAIDVTPEHMSRLEAGDKVLSPQSEMLVRIYTFVSTLPFTTKKKAEASIVADLVGKMFGTLSIKPCHPVGEAVELVLTRVTRPAEAGDFEVDAESGLWDEPTTISEPVPPIAA